MVALEDFEIGSHRDHIGRLERGEVANPHMATIRNLAETRSRWIPPTLEGKQ
jgi:hypothetical protein